MPVEACEPPCCVAGFTTVRTLGQDGRGETGARVGGLVKNVPGDPGTDHARTSGGLGVTVGYSRDAGAPGEWRTGAEHREARKRGRAERYRSCAPHVAKADRSRGFVRPPAPQGPTAG